MTDIAIEREDTDTKGRYIARLPGVAETAELTFSKASPVLVIVDHTGVPDAMQGRGVAGALARRMLADARAAGQRIVPLCPFFKSYAERHPDEARDVVT